MDAELQAILKRNFNMSDSYRELVTEEILAWHQQEIAKARINEISRIEPKGEYILWTTGDDPDMAITLDERIDELSQTLKEGESS